jgi:predicted ATPase
MLGSYMEAPFLKTVTYNPRAEARVGGYPFNLRVVEHLEHGPLSLTCPVTLILGENGAGKSTLIEALACAARLPAIGETSSASDPSLVPSRALAASLRLSWGRKNTRGFFFRAEDYFAFVKRVDSERKEFKLRVDQIDNDESLNEVQRLDARRAFANSYNALSSRYGEQGLDVMSHGESFLALFQSRLVPGGIYLLDEPEAALAPTRCLGLLSLMKHFAESENCQFILATHSPILMAIPGAQRLFVDEEGIREIAYDEIPHVQLFREFLKSPERFLQHL